MRRTAAFAPVDYYNELPLFKEFSKKIMSFSNKF